MIIVCRKLNCEKLTLFSVICANLGIIFQIIKIRIHDICESLSILVLVVPTQWVNGACYG